MAKHPRLPKDNLLQIKQSRPEVEGMPAPINPGFPMGQTQAMTICKYLRLHVHQSAQGEGHDCGFNSGHKSCRGNLSPHSQGVWCRLIFLPPPSPWCLKDT